MVDIADLIGYTFFQRALLGGSIAAVACAAVGVFVLLRKEAMIGHGIAHVSFGGVAVGKYMVVAGVFLGDEDTFPLLTALVVSILATVAITYLRRRGIAESDAAIALITALGFAVGLIIISLADGFDVDVMSFLFGDVLTITSGELVLAAALGAVVLAFLLVFYKEMMSITFDEESARLSGLPVRTLEVVFDVLLALTIVLSIKIIGIILVSALLAIPGVTAFQFKLSFRRTMLVAIAASVASVVLGILLSAVYDVAATSGLIVAVAVLVLALSVLWVRLGSDGSAHERPEGKAAT